MKAFKTLAMLAVGATLLTGAASASATVLVATWTGTVTSGYDSTGVFGAAGTDLTGDAYVAKYTYDTSVGARSSNLPNYDEVSGGSANGIASPISATIEINGRTATVKGSYAGYAITYPNYYNYFTEVQQYAQDYNYTDSGYESNYLYNGAYQYYAPAIQASLDTPVSLTNLAGYTTYGYAEFYTDNYSAGYIGNAYANLGSATLQITNSVPEPAAWAMLIAGFGLTGAAMRRRRVAVAA